MQAQWEHAGSIKMKPNLSIFQLLWVGEIDTLIRDVSLQLESLAQRSSKQPTQVFLNAESPQVKACWSCLFWPVCGRCVGESIKHRITLAASHRVSLWPTSEKQAKLVRIYHKEVKKKKSASNWCVTFTLLSCKNLFITFVSRAKTERQRDSAA